MCEGKTPLCRGSRGSIERQQNAIRCVASFSSNSLCRFCHFRGRFACTHTHEICRLDCVCFRAFRAQWVSTISAVSSHETRLYVSAGCHLPLATLSPFLLPLPAPLPPAKIRCLHFIWIWIWGLILRVAEEWGVKGYRGGFGCACQSSLAPILTWSPSGKVCVCTRVHSVTCCDRNWLTSSLQLNTNHCRETNDDISQAVHTAFFFSLSISHTHTLKHSHSRCLPIPHSLCLVFLSLDYLFLYHTPTQTMASCILSPWRKGANTRTHTFESTHTLTHLNSCPQSY